jgi:dedicated sortase system histidine kinase
MSRPRFWHRVRFKLLLVSLTLLGIPWAGYRFIQETEQFLREAQDSALRTTASSVANVMHGAADEFTGVARPGSVLTFRNLFLHTLDKAPQIDGYRDEWEPLQRNLARLRAPDDRLEVSLFLGRHERYLYLLVGVKDATPAYGPDGDRIELAVTDGDGLLQRYRIQPQAPGWIVAERLLQGDEWDGTDVLEPALRGEWQPHPEGYTLEMRMPRTLIGDRLSVRVRDSASGQLLASGRMFPADALGYIVERSATLQAMLDAVTPAATRIWLTDHQGLVIARSGRLDSDAPLSADQPRMPWFVRELILAVLPRDADTVAALHEGRTHLFMPPVTEALSGRTANLRRQPPGDNAVVVSAAVPIRGNEGVRGAVLVEQTTNAILSLQNLALQRLFGVTLLLFAVTSLLLLGFASLLASRITRLRDSVEAAVSQDGRIVGKLSPDRSRDEIGDLSRSFDSVLQRLSDYNHYLEAMAARLAHELRTPLAVLRTSLDNAMQVEPAAQATYLQRARDGAQRLELIVQRLREATRLEQAMRQAEPTRFDLGQLVRLQSAELQGLYPATEIRLEAPEQAVPMHGAPDLISQALDKLVSNAIDFHRPGSPIRITIHRASGCAHLAVTNEGPALPHGIDVFQSMTSGREGRQAEPHLGLGLFLVRLIAEFHGGAAQAHNLRSPPGVCVTLHLPLAPGA